MAMFIRYDCVIDTPLRALIERLDDLTIYDASSGRFVSTSGLPVLPDSMFVPLTMNTPLPNVHAATVDTSDGAEFPTDAAYGFYVFNGAHRLSEIQSLVWTGPQIVVTIDDLVVYAS